MVRDILALDDDNVYEVEEIFSGKKHEAHFQSKKRLRLRFWNGAFFDPNILLNGRINYSSVNEQIQRGIVNEGRKELRKREAYKRNPSFCWPEVARRILSSPRKEKTWNGNN